MKDPQVIATSFGDPLLQSTPKAAEELKIQLELLAQLNQVVVVLDNQERIILWNKQAEDLYQYGQDEVMGRYLDEIQKHAWIKPADEAKARQELNAVGSWQGQNLHVNREGHQFQVQMSVSLLKNSQGQKQGIIFLIQNISTYTRALNEIKLSNAYYRTILEDQSEMICRFLPDFTISYANKAWCTCLGIEADSAVNTNLLYYLTADYAITLQENLKLLAPENPVAVQEQFMLLKDEDTKWIEWTYRAIFNANGLLLEYQSIGRDVTLRKQVEKALEQSERKYRSLFNTMHEGFALLEIIYNEDGEAYDFRYLDVNPAFERIYGLTRHQVVGKTGYDILLPEEVKFRIQVYGQVARTGKPAYFQKLVTGIDKYFEVIAFRPGPGQCAALFIYITERQQAKQALVESENQMSKILDFLPDATIVVDREGQLLVWNKAAEDMAGVKAQDLAYQGNFAYALPFYGYRRPLLVDLVLQPREEWEKNYSYIQRKAEVLIGENFCPTIGESGAFLRATAAPLYDTQGNMVGAIECIRDITERQQAELALKSSEEKYRRIVETANEGILIINEDNSIQFANNKMVDMLGYEMDELLQMSLLDLLEESDRPQSSAMLEKMRHEKQTELDIKLKSKAGNPFWGICSITNIHDHQGQYTGCLAMITDITARKKLEEEMLQLDRLNLVGQIAAGIGHEIRNPMTAVRGYLQFLISEDAFKPYRETFELMIEEIDRGNSIITEFLLLARNKAVELKMSNLNLIIEALYPLIQVDAVSCDKNIKLELGKIQPLLLDKKEIRQLILNLVRNGMEAMEAGGTVTIKTYSEGQDIILAVSDQGNGIEEDIISRLGTPFFTTKDQGTGLGLPICYGIASRHNANISIETSPSGSTFLVRFTRTAGQ
jgi:two-component system, sporulation sensor kinase E